MSGSPLVSVIAVCYNHAKYLDETLDSIKNQTYKNIELIIIDSYSQDNSIVLIDNWIDKNNIRCKFIKQTSLKGLSQNLNEGLKISTGEYIQVIATDDKLLPEKISKQVDYLKANTEYGIVFSNSYIMNEESVISEKLYKDQELLQEMFLNGSFQELIYKTSFVIPHSALVRRAVYNQVGVYDEKLLIEDWDFFLRVFKSNIRVGFIQDILVVYRVAEKSLWNSKTYKLFKSQIEIFRKHNMFSLCVPMSNYLTMFSIMKFSHIYKGILLLIWVGQIRWALFFAKKYYTATLMGRGMNKLGRMTQNLR